MACRPKTWMIALSPVILGLALSLHIQKKIDIPIAIATGLLSVLMQAITNMENDAAYTRRKAEKSNRKGLPRATSLGLLSVSSVELAIKFCAFFVALDTFYLMYHGGMSIVIISIASVLAAYLYMGGPKPLAYTLFSELVCFTFFGLVAVCGTVYLQCQQLNLHVWLCASILGCLSTAVLVVNNYRDIEHDRSVNRFTLAVTIGKKYTELLYAILLVSPFILIAVLICTDQTKFPILLAFVLFPIAISLIRTLPQKHDYQLNDVLFSTVKFELQLSLLVTLGLIISYFLYS